MIGGVMACLKFLVLSAHKPKCKKDPVQMLVQLKTHVANRLVLVVENHVNKVVVENHVNKVVVENHVNKVVAAHKVSTLHVAKVNNIVSVKAYLQNKYKLL